MASPAMSSGHQKGLPLKTLNDLAQESGVHPESRAVTKFRWSRVEESYWIQNRKEWRKSKLSAFGFNVVQKHSHKHKIAEKDKSFVTFEIKHWKYRISNYFKVWTTLSYDLVNISVGIWLLHPHLGDQFVWPANIFYSVVLPSISPRT